MHLISMQTRTRSLSASSGPGRASASTSDQSFTKHFHRRQASWMGRLQARHVCSSCMGNPAGQRTETLCNAQRGEQEQGSWLPSVPLMHHHTPSLQAFKQRRELMASQCLSDAPSCPFYRPSNDRYFRVVSELAGARCALQLRCSTAGPGCLPLRECAVGHA